MAEIRDAVLAKIKRIAGGSTEIIDRSELESWMETDDLVALGGVYYMLFDPRFHSRIEPALTLDEYLEFTLPYLARCFREDPDLPYAPSRYTAGWDLASWFSKMWRDDAVPREALRRVKRWLAETYRGSTAEVREAIVNATLEHIFETKGVRQFFGDWKEDDVLRAAYSAATAYAGDLTPPSTPS